LSIENDGRRGISPLKKWRAEAFAPRSKPMVGGSVALASRSCFVGAERHKYGTGKVEGNSSVEMNEGTISMELQIFGGV
jgi:hypothetical protein